MQSDRMNNEQYKNWLKVSLSLHYVKQALTEFAQNGSLTLHNQLRENIQQQASTSTAPPIASCTSCTSRSFKKVYNQETKCHTWRVNCTTCSDWLEGILRQHVHWPLKVNNIVWDNTDPRLWLEEPWEVAKVYQPRGCKDNKKAEDGDIAALLSFIADCKPVNQNIAHTQNLHEVRAIRNKVMHSSSLEVSQSDMLLWTNTMIQLLEDPKHLCNLAQCIEAAAKIKELQNNSLDVVLEDPALEIRLIQECQEVTRKDLTKMETRIHELESKMNCRFSSLEGAVATIETKVQKVEHLEKHVCILDEKQDLSKRRLSRIDLIVDENDRRIKQCIKAVEDVKQSKRTSKANENVISTLEKVDSCQKDIDNELRHMEQNRRLLEENCKTLEAVNHVTKSQMDSLRELGKTLLELKNTNANNEVLYTRTSSAPRYTEQQILSLRHGLIDVYRRHCQQINICPLVPDKQKDVDEVYVHPDIQIIKGNDPASENQSLYRKIFFNGNRECKNIYVTGESGVGKSVFCKKLVKMWCRVHSELCGKDLSDDESILADFPLLFYISLEHASSETSIEEMTECQLQLDKDHGISDLLKNVHCLVILDGLDEWNHTLPKARRFCCKGLPERPLCTESTIITTTRPWKLDNLKLQANEIDKQVNITGIGTNSSKELANKVITMLKEDKSRDVTYDDFEWVLEEKHLEHFMSIPLILLQLLCLWYDKKPFGNCQCAIYSNMIELQFKLATEIKQTFCSKHCGEKKSSRKRLPKCFKHNKLCQKYYQLLLSLSGLAFDTLFGDTRNSKSVVDHSIDDAPRLSQKEIEICLQVGILTQKRVEDMFTERKKNIHFIHKTYQEFFAAIYLATEEISVEQVLTKCCSAVKILDISDVFKFLFGMNARKGNQLVQRIMKVIADDDSVHASRKLHTSTLIQDIQGFVMNTLDEAYKNGTKDTLFQLEDVKVDSRNISKIAQHLQNIKTKQMKSLSVNSMQSSYEQNVDYRKVFEHACISKALEKLNLTDNRHFVEARQIRKLTQHSKQTLKFLCLEYVNLTKLPSSGLDITSLCSLESLRLRFVYLSHKQIKSVCAFKRQTDSISEIHLEALRCVDHGPLEKCGYKIKLAEHHVKSLCLSDLDVKDLQLNVRGLQKVQIGHLGIPGTTEKALRCLADATNLKNFQCHWCKEQSGVEQLTKTLPLLINLKTIELSRTEIKNCSLKLSQGMSKLEYVGLKTVTISSNALISFVCSLPRTNHRLYIRLEDMNITDENGKETFVRYLQDSQEPNITVLTLDDCINFYTVVVDT